MCYCDHVRTTTATTTTRAGRFKVGNSSVLTKRLGLQRMAAHGCGTGKRRREGQCPASQGAATPFRGGVTVDHSSLAFLLKASLNQRRKEEDEGGEESEAGAGWRSGNTGGRC